MGATALTKPSAHFLQLVRGDLRQRGYALAVGTQVNAVAVLHGRPLLLVECRNTGRLATEHWNHLCVLAEKLGAIPVLAELQDERLIYRRLLGRRTATESPHERFSP